MQIKASPAPSLRALQKAGRTNPVVKFTCVFKQLIVLSGLLRSLAGDDDTMMENTHG